MISEPGGPAFPGGPACPGLTLRDWFAAYALSGLLASPDEIPLGPIDRTASSLAYEMADAMLVQRQLSTDPDFEVKE